jgi:hypothetical protein
MVCCSNNTDITVNFFRPEGYFNECKMGTSVKNLAREGHKAAVDNQFYSWALWVYLQVATGRGT